ncbi:MAG: ABC transporter permease [Polyangiaceae bacterium]|nr:ABC transporter permease [Polyangiaceae bacterium]
MGFPFDLAIRYMASKKRATVSLGTLLATCGVALGVCGLATAVSVTGGFRKQFREKVLGVNAHVLVLKRSSYFGEYRDVMEKIADHEEIVGIAPFTINPMMVTHGERTATGVMLKGVDPDELEKVLDLPQHMIEGGLEGLRLPGAQPPQPKAERTHYAPPSFDSSLAVDARSKENQGKKKAASPEELALEFLEQLDADKDRGAEGVEADNEKKPPLEGDSSSPVEKLNEEEIEDPGELGDFLAQWRKNAPEEKEPDDERWTLDAGAPVGSIVPEGGYAAALPEDDFLPDEIAGDPCKSDIGVLPGIIIGKTLAENLGAKLGDCVQVTSPIIGFSFSNEAIRAPIARQFRVTGIFYAGFDQYDAKFVYTDLYEAQKFQDSGDSVTGIEMTIHDIDRASIVAEEIDETLGASLYYTTDWEELNHGLFTALKIQQIMMSLVLGLIIIVAAFTVIATLIMVVLEKKKEIAVMKAMGARDGAILRAFLYQGGLIGVAGGLGGLAAALLVCQGLLKYAVPLDPKVYFISRIPVDVRAIDYGLIGVFAVLVCLAATAWPAFHASRLRPADAFRDQ